MSGYGWADYESMDPPFLEYNNELTDARHDVEERLEAVLLEYAEVAVDHLHPDEGDEQLVAEIETRFEGLARSAVKQMRFSQQFKEARA